MTQIHLEFEDNTHVRMDTERLAELSHDVGSWFNFLKLMAGASSATMTAKPHGKPAETFCVQYVPFT